MRPRELARFWHRQTGHLTADADDSSIQHCPALGRDLHNRAAPALGRDLHNRAAPALVRDLHNRAAPALVRDQILIDTREIH
jgi:hypothetical protein